LVQLYLALLVLWRRLPRLQDPTGIRFAASARGCLKSRLRVTDHRRVMPITSDTDKLYDTDLTDAAWALIAPMLPAARRGCRPRTTNIRAVLNAIFYLLRTGCQWRLLPREFPVWSTVYHYIRVWKNGGVWTCFQRSMYQQARRQAGRTACPSVVIMDGQSVKTTERGGIRGFDAHNRVKGRKRHILVDTFGLLIACRVEPADTSDRRAAALLLGGLGALFPNIRTVIADAGHQSRKLARHLLQQDGWKLQIVKRRQRAFKITGLTWIVERSFAWLGRLSKDYEYSVQTSEDAYRHRCNTPYSQPSRIGLRFFKHPPRTVCY
jgi:transposase